MGLNSSNTDYSIVSENELSVILGHFEDDIIIDIVQENLNNKFREYSTNLSNIVYSLEQNFKTTMDQYEYDKQILDRREEVYNLIIRLIADHYNLELNIYEEGIDSYTAAYYLYKFFVSNFSEMVVQFLLNYIYKEYNSLYKMIANTDNKLKDSSISYSKKLHKQNTKLAIVHACINDVIDSICGFNLPLNAVINNTYNGSTKEEQYLQSLISEREESSFFSNHIVPYINHYRPIIITNVRLELQKIFI